MAYDLINIGTPNSNTGDYIRDAFDKSNNNDEFLKTKIDATESDIVEIQSDIVEIQSGIPPSIYHNNTTILTPQDGINAFLGGVTGAIKIKLPEYSNNYIKLFVEIIDENSHQKSYSLIISAVTRTSINRWGYVSAQMISSNALRHTRVRFGFDGSKPCIYIEELNKYWVHLKVVITKIIISGSHRASLNWHTGWDISLETSAFQNIVVSSNINFPT